MIEELVYCVEKCIPLIKFLGMNVENLKEYIHKRMDEKMREIIPKLNIEQLNELLLELTCLIDNNMHLTELLVYATDHCTEFHDKFVDRCFESMELFNKLSLRTRRILWQNRPSKYGEIFLPLVDSYITWIESFSTDIHLNKDNRSTKYPFYGLNPSERRQHESIIEITNLIGESFPLYNLSLQYIRTLWLKTGNYCYCSLRLDILIAMNINGHRNFRTFDPCYRLVWYLENTFHNTHIKKKYLNELHSIVKSATKNKDYSLGDIGMILSDPYVRFLLLNTVVKRMNSNFNNKILPRDCKYLTMVISILLQSFNAEKSLPQKNSLKVKFNVDDKLIYTLLLPICMYQIGFQHSLTNQVKCESLPSLNDFFSPQNSYYTPIFDILFSSELCAHIWWYVQIFLLEQYQNWEMFTWMLNVFVDNLSEYCFLQIEPECDNNSDNVNVESQKKIFTVCFFSEYILLKLLPLVINVTTNSNSNIEDIINWPNLFDCLFVRIPNILKHNGYHDCSANVLKMGIKILSIIGPFISEDIFNEISDMIAVFTEEMKF